MRVPPPRQPTAADRYAQLLASSPLPFAKQGVQILQAVNAATRDLPAPLVAASIATPGFALAALNRLPEALSQVGGAVADAATALASMFGNDFDYAAARQKSADVLSAAVGIRIPAEALASTGAGDSAGTRRER